MTNSQRAELRAAVNEFLRLSAAPRTLDGEHCDHCHAPMFQEHKPDCKYKLAERRMKEIAWSDLK
jgi:hypothetical protein